MKKQVLVLALLPYLLTECGGSSSSETPTSPPNPSQSVVKTFTVTFEGTSIPTKQVNEGGSLEKPSDPVKEGHLFVGWYLDAAFTQEATFPLMIRQNTTLYAQFYSYKTAFAKARENTIGEAVPGYEYDYTLHMSVSYSSFSFSGDTSGRAQYVKGANDVRYYDNHTNSGALFYDGSKYEILKGATMHTISFDENDTVTKYKTENVGEDYRYDSSSFAKAIFEYDETKLKSISRTTVPDEYQLQTSFNASSGIALIGKYVNHPIVESLIGNVPETDVKTGMYVTFSGKTLNTYRYTMNISVSSVTMSLTYHLTFRNVGAAPTITPRALHDIYISESEINTAKAAIQSPLNAYQALTHSSYDFTVKTGVDYDGKNAINATVQGFTKRKVDAGTSYFLNDYEVDTDLKNADLYKDKGLKDCHGGRVKLSTGEVHDLKKKLTSGYTDVKTVEADDADDFYLFNLLSEVSKFTFIQKITDTKKGTTLYSIGGDDASAVEMLNYFNDHLRLNALGECSVDVKAFGSFSSDTVSVKDFRFTVLTNGSGVSEISVKVNGKMQTAFPESKEFSTTRDAAFDLKFTLTITNKGSAYEPAAEVSKVK